MRICDENSVSVFSFVIPAQEVVAKGSKHEIIFPDIFSKKKPFQDEKKDREC